MIIEDGLFYYWQTEEWHYDNNETMYDFLSYELPKNIEVTHEDGSYAEVKLEDGRKFEVHASGNGDCYNHKVEFVRMAGEE